MNVEWCGNEKYHVSFFVYHPGCLLVLSNKEIITFSNRISSGSSSSSSGSSCCSSIDSFSSKLEVIVVSVLL